MKIRNAHYALLLLIGLAISTYVGATKLRASDHDDGEIDLKGRALNITDVYAFREDNQTGNAADRGNLILIMNTSPRSLPGQQYYFSTNALYDFHITRVSRSQKAAKPTGANDIVLRFQFGAPDEDLQQPITLTVIKDGTSTPVDRDANGQPILTTSIAMSKSNQPVVNDVTVGSARMAVFAGLREDPFFFDVERFFRVREAAVKGQGFIGFNPAATAKDFTHNYNVNGIAVRVPIQALQASADQTVFDVWTTISVPK